MLVVSPQPAVAKAAVHNFRRQLEAIRIASRDDATLRGSEDNMNFKLNAIDHVEDDSEVVKDAV